MRNRAIGWVGALLLAGCASSAGSTVADAASRGDAVSEGEAPTASARPYPFDPDIAPYPMTDVSCSYDRANDVVRAFEGRFCTPAICYVVRVNRLLPPVRVGGVTRRIEVTVEAAGGAPAPVEVFLTSAGPDTSTAPRVDRILIQTSFGEVTIRGCPFS